MVRRSVCLRFFMQLLSSFEPWFLKMILGYVKDPDRSLLTPALTARADAAAILSAAPSAFGWAQPWRSETLRVWEAAWTPGVWSSLPRCINPAISREVARRQWLGERWSKGRGRLCSDADLLP